MPEEKKDEKLIAGKYKTVEEAETAIKEGERKMHEATQDAAYWRRQTQDLLAGSVGDDPTQQGPQVTHDVAEYSRKFLENPKAGLDDFGKRIVGEVVRNVATYLDARDTVQEFITANPAIKENVTLFYAHMDRTDPAERSISRRLGKALESFSADIKIIKDKAKSDEEARLKFEQDQKDKLDTSPAGGGARPTGRREEKDDEATFDSYMSDREKSRERMLIPPQV